jgi:hypothetical protein
MAIIDDFREAALPRLRHVIRAQAFFAALEIIDLDEARSIVYAEARKSGSNFLSNRDQDRLNDWIAELLWQEIDKANDRVAALRSRAFEAERADPVRYYDGLAARCSNPEAMRWTFAAICPAYRKYLNGERHNAGQG